MSKMIMCNDDDGPMSSCAHRPLLVILLGRPQPANGYTFEYHDSGDASVIPSDEKKSL